MIDHAASINCRGFGGGLRPQWGARGAKPARIREAHMRVSSGEREGQARSQIVTSGEREGQSSHPLCEIKNSSALWAN